MLRMNLLVITYTHFYLLASPHATGIVDQIPPEELRRGLMLLSKVREWLSRNIVGQSVRPSVRPSVVSHTVSPLISPCCQPIGQSLSIHQSVNFVNQSINWSSSQSFSRSVSQSIINSVSQEVSSLPVRLPVSLSCVNQSILLPVSSSVWESIVLFTCKSADPSLFQTYRQLLRVIWLQYDPLF